MLLAPCRLQCGNGFPDQTLHRDMVVDALFDGGACTHDAWADISSTLLHLPLRHLTKILAHDPEAIIQCRWGGVRILDARRLRAVAQPSS